MDIEILRSVFGPNMETLWSFFFLAVGCGIADIVRKPRK